MKSWLLILGITLASFPTLAEIDPAIANCLRKWPNHPFDAKNPVYRTIGTKVKVLGIGGNSKEEKPTEKPELVLVKPGVSVMSKSTYELLNPNGWYCIKGKVSVLGKIQINLACKAKIASSDDETEVLGATDDKSNGVAVLGSVRLQRQCN